MNTSLKFEIINNTVVQGFNSYLIKLYLPLNISDCWIYLTPYVQNSTHNIKVSCGLLQVYFCVYYLFLEKI